MFLYWVRQTFLITGPIALEQVLLMQGLADGYYVAPYTVGNYLADHKPDGMDSRCSLRPKEAEAKVEE